MPGPIEFLKGLMSKPKVRQPGEGPQMTSDIQLPQETWSDPRLSSQGFSYAPPDAPIKPQAPGLGQSTGVSSPDPMEGLINQLQQRNKVLGSIGK